MTNPHLRPDDAEALDEIRGDVHGLFHAHYAELCRFANRCVKSRALAEELVQDVFLRIWQQQVAVGAERQAITRPYLYRAVRNHALDHLKHQRVEQAWAARSAQEPPSSLSPDHGLDAATLAAAARRAVDQLPERCRLVFLLRREQNLSCAEIAATLGMSPKTVENHMGRALRLLREKLATYLPVGLVVSAAEALRLLR